MTYLVELQIDIAFIQEAWIRKSDGHLLTEVREYGYEILLQRKARRLDLGGGEAVFHRHDFKVQNLKSSTVVGLF